MARFAPSSWVYNRLPGPGSVLPSQVTNPAGCFSGLYGLHHRVPPWTPGPPIIPPVPPPLVTVGLSAAFGSRGALEGFVGITLGGAVPQLAASGVLSAAVSAVQHSPAATLAGHGVLSPTAAATKFTLTCALRGRGVLSSTAVAQNSGAAVLSGRSVLSVTAHATKFVLTSSLSSRSVLVSGAQGGGGNIALLSGHGALSVTAHATKFALTSVPHGHGVLAVAASAKSPASAALSGHGVLAAAAFLASTRSCALPGHGVMTPTAHAVTPAALSSQGVLSTSVQLQLPYNLPFVLGGNQSLSGAAALSSKGVLVATAKATKFIVGGHVAGRGSFTAAAQGTGQRTAALAAHSVLSAAAATVGAESGAGTAVTTVGPTINASTTPGSAGSGNVLAITSGGQISLDGTVPSAYSGTAGVAELFYIDHTAWQQNSAGNWYGPITATSSGTAQSSPLPTIALSSNTVPASSASGTVIGALSVTTGLATGASGTGVYTWSYALSGTNASDFKLSGSNLETAVANLATGTYTLTVTATATGVAGGPYTLPVTVTVGGTGPTGTMQTLTVQATSDFNYPAGSAYQPANSPWWAFNNAESGVQGTLNIQYYPNNFPNYTTILWASPAFSYPELIIGAQGPNHSDYIYGPNGTTNGQSATPPSWLPSWFNTPLNELSHIIFSWNITYNTNNNNNFDTLCETWLGPSGTSGEPPYETPFVIKDPHWWTGTHTATIGGESYYFIPGGEPTSSSSLTIIPASVYAGTGGGNTPMLTGSVDLWPLLSYAATQGWTSMGYTLVGWEFGNEVGDSAGMTGSVTYNSISFDVS